MGRLRERFRGSRFHYLYNLRDEKARGRVVLLSTSAVSSLAGTLTSGLFYTTFLISNGIDLVNIGILTFLPYIASCFSVFSPSILERIRRRRWVLASLRLGYYVFFILGVTVIPQAVADPGWKKLGFIACVFLGHVLNALATTGYSAWHVNFLPDEVRAEHFGITLTFSNAVNLGLGLLFCLIADSFSGPEAQKVIVLFRYLGFGLGLVHTALLACPAEYPYEHTGGENRLRDVIAKPLRYRKYMGSVLLVAVWTFCQSLPAGVLNYYLLEDLGVRYTYVQIVNALYPVFLFAFMIPCRRAIKKLGWVGTYDLGIFLLGLSFMAYSLMTKQNYLFLFPAVRIFQHLLGSHFTDTPVNNFSFMNIPEKDRTNCIAFYVLVNNAAAFLGVMSGTWFVALTPGLNLTLFGIPYGHCQVILLTEGICFLLFSAVVRRFRARLEPAGTV